MRKIEEVKLVLVLASAGVLVSLGCGSSSSGNANPGGGGNKGGGGAGGLSLGLGKDAGAGADGGNGGAVVGGQGGDATGGSLGTGGSVGGGGLAGGGGAGGGAVGAGGSVGTNLPIDQYSQTFATVLCQRLLQCCMVPPGLDQESCANEAKGILDLLLAEYQPYLMNGKATYHGDRAAACVNGLNAATCSVINMGSTTLNMPCDTAIESQVAPGGACMDDLECKDGWCDTTTTMKCVAKKADGAPCEDDADCLSDNCSVVSQTCAPAAVEGLCPDKP
jgi:hypothetical protein